MTKAPQKEASAGGAKFNRFIDHLAITLTTIFEFVSAVCLAGAKQVPYKSRNFWYWTTNVSLIFLIFAVLPPRKLGDYLRDHSFPVFIQKNLLLPDHRTFRIYFYLSIVWITVLFAFGIFSYLKLKSFQNSLDKLRLGNEGNRPQVIAVKITDDHKTKIKIRSLGLGYEKLLARKGDLEASFNQVIETIYPEEGNPQVINISMSKIPLPRLLLYEDFAKELQREGDFLVGQSRQGFVVQNIADLPHLLIAGTTGSGKSVFFKQAIISLMESTPTSIFHLMDFKRGVEFGVFSSIPNTTVIKTKSAALIELKKISVEMHARFDFLEKEKITKLSPEIHKFPRIFLAIDEASELLGLPDRLSSDKQTIAESRQIVNDIAKLGRAACIHIIVATQKVSKTVIDTALQENIGGRMAFRMATLANSTQAIGAKEATELPEIPGRAIWNFGTKFTEVQVPYLDEKYLAKKIKQVSDLRALYKADDKSEVNSDKGENVKIEEKENNVDDFVAKV